MVRLEGFEPPTLGSVDSVYFISYSNFSYITCLFSVSIVVVVPRCTG